MELTTSFRKTEAYISRTKNITIPIAEGSQTYLDQWLHHSSIYHHTPRQNQNAEPVVYFPSELDVPAFHHRGTRGPRRRGVLPTSTAASMCPEEHTGQRGSSSLCTPARGHGCTMRVGSSSRAMQFAVAAHWHGCTHGRDGLQIRPLTQRLSVGTCFWWWCGAGSFATSTMILRHTPSI